MNKKLTVVDKQLYDVLKSTCKIICSNIKGGSGFFIKLYKGKNPFYCLMTCEHVITETMIEKGDYIQIYYDYDNKNISINLNKSERFIKSYIYLNIDTTVVEILEKEKDKITEEYFLLPLPYLDIINEELINKKIIILQYQKLKDLGYSDGEIQSINNYEFSHLSNTKKGSSGGPIFLKGNSTKVLGIHFGKENDETKNFGNFIWPISDSLKLDLEYGKISFNNDEYQGELKNNIPEGFGKYTWQNGKYYIGQWKNGKKEGKGAKYAQASNGKDRITYEGDFHNDLYDGKGKYTFSNGEYYIGEWSKGERNGKGKEYYNDNKLRYDGDFVNGKYEGNGEYYFENEEYYIGQFLEGKRHGNGKLFYKDKNIKYEGEFKNDNLDGKGKYYYKNGESYDGQWLNGKKHGKGIYYYKNNKDDRYLKKKYEGDFINDLFEGQGRYNYENGEYYIGQWKNGNREGEGTEFFENGTIKRKGIFINDKYSN